MALFFFSQSILQDYIFTKYTLGNAEFMVCKVCNFYFIFKVLKYKDNLFTNVSFNVHIYLIKKTQKA